MTDIAIRCERLSKRYEMGERESYNALRDVITDAAAVPFRIRLALACQGQGADEGNVGIGELKPEKENEFWALNDISCDVDRGEVIAIIRRNGAGKSTFFNILSRIAKTTTGRVEIHGRVESLLEVGTSFHPELTGRSSQAPRELSANCTRMHGPHSASASATCWLS